MEFTYKGYEVEVCEPDQADELTHVYIDDLLLQLSFLEEKTAQAVVAAKALIDVLGAKGGG